MTVEPKQKQAVWRARMEEWRGSGQTQARYCREKGWSLATFGFWKQRLAERSEERLVRLSPPPGRREAGRKRMILLFPDGLKVVFSDRTPVTSVVEIVEKLCGSIGAR